LDVKKERYVDLAATLSTSVCMKTLITIYLIRRNDYE